MSGVSVCVAREERQQVCLRLFVSIMRAFVVCSPAPLFSWHDDARMCAAYMQCNSRARDRALTAYHQRTHIAPSFAHTNTSRTSPCTHAHKQTPRAAAQEDANRQRETERESKRLSSSHLFFLQMVTHSLAHMCTASSSFSSLRSHARSSAYDG